MKKSLKKGFLGQYTYISMAKVDIYEHENLDIKVTAVHEYIHSHLVRGTLYGNFMRGIDQANLIDNRYNKIFDMLYKNEEKIQETTATLIELIYVWYKKGLSTALANFKKLPKPYSKYIREYEHLLNLEYVMKVYKQYWEFIDQKIERNSKDEEYCKRIQKFNEEMIDDTEEKSALNVILYLILKIAEFSMTIDMGEIDASLWESEKKFTKYIRNQHSKKYHPNARFKEYMKNLFPNKTTNIDRFILDSIVILPNKYNRDEFLNVDNYILERYEGGVDVDKNLIKNKLNESMNIYIPFMNRIDKLETEAMIYALPYPLNIESAEKLFGDAFWVDEGIMDKELMEIAIENAKIIHIHPTTGIENPFSYHVKINSTFNAGLIENLHDVKRVLQGSYVTEYLADLFTLIENYKGIIYITGCHRSKGLLNELINRNKENKIFINSVASLTSSIEFLNMHFSGNDGEIIRTKYCDIMILRNSYFTFFQYLLPKSDEIIRNLIKEKRIHLSQLKVSEKSTILNQSDWGKIKLFTEQFYKERCTYMANKGW
ncbi:TPA: hypothetical protein ACQUHN_004166 [Bacillus thuringiensis]